MKDVANDARERRKGACMDFPKKSGWLIGAGVLLGAVGAKALTGPTAKKCYVQGVAKGLQAKAAYEGIVEQAKAEVDDIVAQASYINVQSSLAGEPSAAADESSAVEPAKFKADSAQASKK